MSTDIEELAWDPRARYREFYTELRKAFLAAGPPTYSRLVEIMRRLQEQDRHRIALGASGLQAMMNQGYKILPRWATLSSVIEALRVAAEETGLDPDAVGTVQEWHQRLLQAAGEAAREEATGKAVAGREEDQGAGTWERKVPGDG